MFSILSITIILAVPQLSTANYLEAEANYQKPKLERNNIVNKGVWLRNKLKDNLFQKTSLSNFVFRPNSLDADRLLQANFGTFAENFMDETPIVSAYIERARRSTEQVRKRSSKKKDKRKSLKIKKLKHSTEESTSNSKVPNPKPTSVFNNYPYEVAIVLNNNRKELLNLINDRSNQTNDNVTTNYKTSEVNGTLDTDQSKNVTDAITTEENVSSPKRNTHNYGIDNKEPLDVADNFYKTDGTSVSHTILNRDDKIWHQNAPIPDTNVYEVVAKDKTKPVNERGLIKVISMLTKTFKKIMKQHSEVKRMYEKFDTINDDFNKQVNVINAKFQDFDLKYTDMIQFNDRLRTIENKLTSEEENLILKHKKIDNNIIQFENQQKNFLAQQKQFYTIQKLMLAQNEKILMKQNSITKTQSEISHRQNNFARILKKTKQLFINSRKLNQSNNENDNKSLNTVQDTETNAPTTNIPFTLDTVKFNLFSIPTKTKLSNQDDLIIKEKDKRPIDDLVYKYYFNNTFIDNLMKSKILNNYATNTNSIEIARNVKSKRDELETTILLPITTNTDSKIRVRRWINHKNQRLKPNKNVQILKLNPEITNAKKDPFLTMAKSFCNEIGQNNNVQTLNWCIEKALRKLRFMDKKLFPDPVTIMKEQKPQQLQLKVSKDQLTTETPRVTLFPFSPSTVWMATSLALDPISTPLYAVPNQDVFFPDNEELESNLKQFDLTPDTEGNVYYDGSLHLSDIGHIAHDSDGMSNIMPELINSNCQAETQPVAMDIQSKRRAYVTRLNQDILRKLKARKL